MVKTEILLMLAMALFGKVHCQKLQVEVLFESLCPDSYTFITEQLYPQWRQLSPYIDLKLVPFGKSQSFKNGALFQCQHGPKECEGNKVISCALSRVPLQDLQVEYTNCFMNTFKRDTTDNILSNTCATSVGVDALNLLDCVNSSDGIVHQLKAEQVTAQYHPTFIPTIIYNGKYSPTLQSQSLIDFKGTVCNLLSTLYFEKPGVCSNGLI